MSQDSIKFTGYMIDKFLLEKNDNIPKEIKGTLNLEPVVYKSTEKGKEISYMVSLHLITYTERTKLDLIFNGFFDISNKIEQEKLNYFLDVSAPAILYPYIRTFISNVTSFDADNTVILPVIDFNNFSNREKKQK